MIGFRAGCLLAVILGSTVAQAAIDTIEVRDGAVATGAVTTWNKSHVWRMHGKVFVRAGSRLVVEAGTTVLADARQDSATVLVVARGGRLLAEGTAAEPVVFTSELDPMSGALAPTSLNRGLWGGIVILGRAANNLPGGVGNQTKYIDGDLALLSYGDSVKTDAHDTSGVLRYVSIRYTGIADKSTIKGLTLASVGDGTVIDHVEVYCGADDGIDLLGGTVNLKHVVSSFQAGDALFYSQGYRGSIQYLFLLQGLISGGASNGVDIKIETGDTLLHPVSIGNIWNATVIGTGSSTGNSYTGKYKYALFYKKDGAGTFANSIVSHTALGGVFVDSSKLKDAAGSRTTDSLGTSLLLLNNLWTHIGKGDSLAGVSFGLPTLMAYLGANGNTTEDPLLNGYSWSQDKGLDPRPAAGGAAFRDLAPVPANGFLETAGFRGAFGRSNWAAGWTALSRGGFFADSANVIPSAIASRSVPGYGRMQLENGTLRIRLPQAQQGRLEILDMAGRSEAMVSQGSFAAGETTVALSGQGGHGLRVVRFEGSATRMSCVVLRP
jgi:trimeric autotransporter adhesin